MVKVRKCTNIIKLTFFGFSDEDNFKRSKLIYNELDLKFKVHEMYATSEHDSIITEYCFFSEFIAPVQFLQHLCNKYNLDIIGVSYEFIGGYVESYELQNQISEEVGTHVLNFIKDDKVEVELVEELPRNQYDDILEAEFPLEINKDEINLSDENILDQTL